jgi:hypothetical protein
MVRNLVKGNTKQKHAVQKTSLISEKAWAAGHYTCWVTVLEALLFAGVNSKLLGLSPIHKALWKKKKEGCLNTPSASKGNNAISLVNTLC